MMVGIYEYLYKYESVSGSMCRAEKNSLAGVVVVP